MYIYVLNAHIHIDTDMSCMTLYSKTLPISGSTVCYHEALFEDSGLSQALQGFLRALQLLLHGTPKFAAGLVHCASQRLPVPVAARMQRLGLPDSESWADRFARLDLQILKGVGW